MLQFQSLFRLPLSNLQSDWYSLSACEIMANYMRNYRVFNRDSTNIGQITNLTLEGERPASTTQSPYSLYYETIRTELHNWSQSSDVDKLRFLVVTSAQLQRSWFVCDNARCNSSVPVRTQTRTNYCGLEWLLTLLSRWWPALPRLPQTRPSMSPRIAMSSIHFDIRMKQHPARRT
jgi:hypothetical protein